MPAQQQAIIDGAMNLGGPTCAVATVEHLTGIQMDHFVEFDFNSFRTMVDTLGGVEVCLPQAVNDPYSNLHLRAGRHLITGNQALAFVRTRHGVGDGSDLGRIELQQEFFSSLIQKIESDGTLENPVELYDIANTATQSVTVDPGLGSISKLLSLADDPAPPAHQGRHLRHDAHDPGPGQQRPAAPRGAGRRHALAAAADRHAVARARCPPPRPAAST